MSKTPEEMAREYANNLTRESERFVRSDVEYAFFSGYEAAKDEEATKDQKIAALWTESIKKMLSNVHEITLFSSKLKEDK